MVIMGYFYEAMDKAKEAIKAYHGTTREECELKDIRIWDVIDGRRNNMFHDPIHATWVYLNPFFFLLL
jgi:hypothetical protein